MNNSVSTRLKLVTLVTPMPPIPMWELCCNNVPVASETRVETEIFVFVFCENLFSLFANIRQHSRKNFGIPTFSRKFSRNPNSFVKILVSQHYCKNVDENFCFRKHFRENVCKKLEFSWKVHFPNIVMSWLSCPSYSIPAVLPGCPVLAIPSRLSCSYCPVPAVLF
jgi:hypothetical protein